MGNVFTKARRISSAIFTTTLIKTLDLSSNKITNVGIKILVQNILPSFPQLSNLDVRLNQFSSEGGVCLFTGLVQHCSHLHTLDVSRNAIGSESFTSTFNNNNNNNKNNNLNMTATNGEEETDTNENSRFVPAYVVPNITAGEALRDLLQSSHALSHLNIESCSFDEHELRFISRGVDTST